MRRHYANFAGSLVALHRRSFLPLQLQRYSSTTTYWAPSHSDSISIKTLVSLIVKNVSAEGAAARAGMRAGNRILTVDAIPITTKTVDVGWFTLWSNFENGPPLVIEVERQGQPSYSR
jgi:C-terminal processing protease CtpA/Prc